MAKENNGRRGSSGIRSGYTHNPELDMSDEELLESILGENNKVSSTPSESVPEHDESMMETNSEEAVIENNPTSDSELQDDYIPTEEEIDQYEEAAFREAALTSAHYGTEVSDRQRRKLRKKALNRKLGIGKRILRVIGVIILLLVLAAVACGAVWWISNVKAPESVEPSSSAVSSEESVTDSESEEIVRGEGYYTFLLAGQDMYFGTTDVLMLMSFDVTNGQINAMSIPRNTIVDIQDEDKSIGEVLQHYGMEMLVDVVSGITGVAVDYSILVKLEAVGALVDAMGGVEYNVPCDMKYSDPYQNLEIDLEAGSQLLSGEQAMQLVCWRQNSGDESNAHSDLERVEMHHDFLNAVLTQLLQPKNIVNLTDFTKVFYENVTSELTIGNVLWFAQQLIISDSKDIDLFTLPGTDGIVYNEASYYVIDAESTCEVLNDKFNPSAENIEISELSIIHVDEDGQLVSTFGTTETESSN